ncbi:MAG TPA: type I restriction enzyme HsdR N-terminal domain-containing protein, partial [Bacteroidales bacterium]|nr:type I restriction enzyme HsdR N-terminal domain-containing protein [Bacteroidales bacterium]
MRKGLLACSFMEWFKTKGTGNLIQVFDPIRRRYVALTPEEKVRQQVLQLLVDKLNVPEGLIAVEYTIKLGKLTKRCDIVVFSEKFSPILIV